MIKLFKFSLFYICHNILVSFLKIWRMTVMETHEIRCIFNIYSKKSCSMATRNITVFRVTYYHGCKISFHLTKSKTHKSKSFSAIKMSVNWMAWKYYEIFAYIYSSHKYAVMDRGFIWQILKLRSDPLLFSS